MPVDIIIGGQAGDEGKGKISAYLSLHKKYDACVRVSGPNAGHSIIYNGKKVGLATLPCGAVNKDLTVIIGRAAFINVERLLQEMQAIELDIDKLAIDRYATIITEEHIKAERGDVLDVRTMRIRIYEDKSGKVLTWMFSMVIDKSNSGPDDLNTALKIEAVGTKPLSQEVIRLEPCLYYNNKDICPLYDRFDHSNLVKEAPRYPIPCPLASKYKCFWVKDYYYELV